MDTTNASPRMNLVVALACEARPFIDYYRLSRCDDDSQWSIYVDKQRDIFLIVCGVGRLAASAATSYLYARSQAGPSTLLLNIGIAGGAKVPIGSCWWVDKIYDPALNRHYYPSLLANVALPSVSIMTRDVPQMDYPEEGLVDMEAAGFFASARCLQTQELIQVIKVVSDNQENTLCQIKPERVTKTLVDNREKIVLAMDAMQKLAQTMLDNKPVERLMSAFLKTYHVSQYQQHQLQALLHRWCVVFSSASALALMTEVSTVKQLLPLMQSRLNKASYRWSYDGDDNESDLR